MELIISPIFWGCLVPATIAACHDLKSYLLPNYLTVFILVVGLGHGIYAGSWNVSLIGAGIGFLIGFIGAVLGQMGMGDVKMMAGLGAWLNPAGFLVVLLIACCIGVIWSCIKFFHSGGLRKIAVKHIKPVWRRLPEEPQAPVPPEVVPFGTCLGAALWLFILLVIWGNRVSN